MITNTFNPSADILEAVENTQALSQTGHALKPFLLQNVQLPMDGAVTALNPLNDSSFTPMTFEPAFTAENRNTPIAPEAKELKQAACLVAMAVAPLALMIGIIGMNSFGAEAHITRRAANWATSANHVELRAGQVQRLMSQKGG